MPKLFAAKRKEADLTSHVGLFNGIFGTFLLLVRPILSPLPLWARQHVRTCAPAPATFVFMSHAYTCKRLLKRHARVRRI